MKKLLNEFKAFAVKGNVVDLAVGVVIGSAFGKIVTSLVNDIVMPVIGLILGKINFKDLKLVLEPAVEAADGTVEKAELALNYGNFIQSIVDFLIISFSIFLVIKVISNIRQRFEKQREKEESEKAAEPTKTEILLTEIRDLLKDLKHK